jgi:TldD protein
MEAADAAARVNRRRVDLAPVQPVRGTYSTPVERDPWDVPIDEKIDLALRADGALRASAAVSTSRVEIVAFRTEKVLCTTEGARLGQDLTECGGALFALATGDAKPARRSFSNYGQAGWEFVERLSLPVEASRVGEEAAALLTAPYVEPGETDVVLGSGQLALMVHETCGHPTELDRVLGFEDAFAGGSFLLPEGLGSLRYGSEHVSLSADSTLPEGLGTFGWDDDGVPAQRFPLVRDGIFCGYLSSRETAPMIGWERSTGCSRADGWGRVPIVRMVNVSLDPGEMSLDDLIGDVRHGLYLDTPSSWSLDDRRLNFHFGVEYGREIRNGRLGELRRGATLQDMTPHFWGRCDGVAGRDHWALWGLLSCAKGEPLQSLHVGHGAAPARFRNVRVGVER